VYPTSRSFRSEGHIRLYDDRTSSSPCQQSRIEINPYPVYPSPYPTSNHRIFHDANSTEAVVNDTQRPPYSVNKRSYAPFSLCTVAYLRNKLAIVIRGSSEAVASVRAQLPTFCTLSSRKRSRERRNGTKAVEVRESGRHGV
jgi:hypothetical protein